MAGLGDSNAAKSFFVHLFFLYMWPVWPRMRWACALSLFLNLLHLLTSLKIAAFNIKSFGVTKAQNSAVMGHIREVWDLPVYYLTPSIHMFSSQIPTLDLKQNNTEHQVVHNILDTDCLISNTF